MTARHFLDVSELSRGELNEVVQLAESNSPTKALSEKSVALVFEKPSARTRSSTEVAVFKLGGHPVYIRAEEVGLDSRESVEDVARTLGCYYDVICARVVEHETLVRIAAALDSMDAQVPVVNLLSDLSHPCQALADLLTMRDLLAPLNRSESSLTGRTVSYVGDANNVCRSLVQVALAAGMDVRVASPEGYGLSEEVISSVSTEDLPGSLEVFSDPTLAVRGADVVYTDVWTSMGQEDEAEERTAVFKAFSVDEKLMQAAGEDAYFMHCLPAHRGDEVSAGVIDGPQSAVWRQAAKRETAMVALLSWLKRERR